MNWNAAFVLAVIALAAILFISDRLRPDLIALLVLIVLGVSGILTPQETLSGFSRSAVITILGIFVLTAGLEKTGVTHTLGTWLIRLGGGTEGRMLVVLMLAGAFLSLFMNNIAAGSVLLPVAVGIARERGISPSKLMMPLAFGTTLGGMATLLTTVNILTNAVLTDNHLTPFGLFDFAPIGVPIVFVGIVYMFFIGRQLLPRRAPADWTRLMQASRRQLSDIYGLQERTMHARVPPASQLVGQTLEQAGLGRALGVNVIAIAHHGTARIAPPPSEPLQAGDDLYLEARPDQSELLQQRGVHIEPDAHLFQDLRAEGANLFEFVPAPRSNALGKTLRELHFREKFGLSVVAIWREGKPRRVGIGDLPLQPGDTLLALGSRRRAEIVQSDPDFIVLLSTPEENLRRGKARLALTVMIGALLSSATGVLPVAEAMLAGAIAMVLVGALTMDEVYQSIEWRAIFLIAGMLPAGLAMTKTGAAALVGNLLVTTLGGFPHIILLAGLMLITVALTQVMSGQATIVILAPIAITAALQLQSDPRTFAMGVALASSMAFLTPLGHPVNILVMGPGGYKFGDYVRVGTILTMVLLLVILVLLPLIWGV
ncbi:MAG: SLC13 family permease [Anaerolineae bacterium]